MSALNKVIAKSATSLLTFGDVYLNGGQFLGMNLTVATAVIPPIYTNITDAYFAGYAPPDLFDINTVVTGLTPGTTYYLYASDRDGVYTILQGPIAVTMPASITAVSAAALTNCEPSKRQAASYTYTGAAGTGYIFTDDALPPAEIALTTGQVVDLSLRTTANLTLQTKKELLVVVGGVTTLSVTATADTWKWPPAAYYEANKSFCRVRPKNVVVCYRADQVGADTIANYYKTARGIPAGNVTALTGLSTGPTAGGETSASAVVLLQKVVAAIAAAAPNVIKAIVMVGDFTEMITDKAHAITRVSPSIFSCLVHPAAAIVELQKATTVPFPVALPVTGAWGPAVVGATPALDPTGYSDCHFWQNPGILPGDTYAVCNFPIGPSGLTGYSDGVAVALARIDDMIANEQAAHTDWGVCLLAHGTQAVSGPFIANMCSYYNTLTPAGLHWYGLGGAEGVPPYPAGIAATHDSFGWARYQPGEPSFPVGGAKPSDVGLRSAGVLNYYEGAYTQVEQPGDYNYRRGAIVFCAQSYGAYPGSGTNFVDNYKAAPTFATLAARAVYGGAAGQYLALTATGTNGTDAEYATIYRDASTTNDGHTVEQSPTVVIFKLNGVEQGGAGNGRVTLTGKTVQQAIDALILKAASISASDTTAQWSVNCSGNRRMSRALAAWRSGAVALGVTTEPTADGHVKTIGLFPTLFTGGNIAEWLLRAHAGWTSGGFQPQAWACYIDPLYAPFYRAKVPPRIARTVSVS